MSEPRMSVVLVTDDYDSISPVLDRLVRQTAREHLEVVVVTPSPEQIPAAAANLQGFAAVQVLQHGPPLDLGDGRAAGVRAASAALVFIGETHSYPHPQLAQTLIDAHAGPWAAVVPGFGIANPDSVLSWAGFLSDYGPWLEGLPAEEITYAPNYNASYRRSVLLELGMSWGPRSRTETGCSGGSAEGSTGSTSSPPRGSTTSTCRAPERLWPSGTRRAASSPPSALTGGRGAGG